MNVALLPRAAGIQLLLVGVLFAVLALTVPVAIAVFAAICAAESGRGRATGTAADASAPDRA